MGSSGGHLCFLYQLKPFWEGKEHFWVTFDKEDSRSLLNGERMYPAYYPSNRSLKALIINTQRAREIIKKEKPDLIISAGAAPAVPFIFLGKTKGIKTIYIEPFDRVEKGSLTGRLCYGVADVFIVQWKQMKKVFPKSVYLGSIF